MWEVWPGSQGHQSCASVGEIHGVMWMRWAQPQVGPWCQISTDESHSGDGRWSVVDQGYIPQAEGNRWGMKKVPPGNTALDIKDKTKEQSGKLLHVESCLARDILQRIWRLSKIGPVVESRVGNGRYCTNFYLLLLWGIIIASFPLWRSSLKILPYIAPWYFSNS